MTITNNLDITEKALNDHIEILRDKLDYAVRHRDRVEEELQVAIENAAEKKRELDLAMEEKRKLTKLKLTTNDNNESNY